MEWYPLVLLALVLRRRAVSGRLGSGAIWWITAGACMTVAVPVVFAWMDRRYGIPMWYQIARQLFSVWFGESVFASILGLAMATASFASVSAFVATVWTICRGVRGRNALLICAALLTVSAGCMVVVLGATVWETRSYLMAGPMSSAWWEQANWVAEMLRDCAVCMAFPLAVRMALSLAEVRERLDGMKTVAAEGA
jgi:hypothetical protein